MSDSRDNVATNPIPSSTTPADRSQGHEESQLYSAIERFLALHEANHPADIDTFVAEYPNIACELKECLAGLALLRQAGATIGLGLDPDGGLCSENGTIQPLGDFRIVREIGRGGMGLVYEAEQLSLGRRVALKVLPLAATLDPRSLQRFKLEALAVGQLDHPHIVDVFGVGCERGVHYYAMRYIEGSTIADIIRARRQTDADGPRGSVSAETVRDQAASTATSHSRPYARRFQRDFRQVAELGSQAAFALHHAHQVGIVHRDIKPSNLMLDERGKLWITDFGLARIESSAALTMGGAMLGTLRYMSPEQASGKSDTLDHRTDVYSLGITLFELLTLRPAFAAEDRQTLLNAILQDQPILEREERRSIPLDLQTIVFKAIAKEPGDRYTTAQALADDLQRFIEQRPIEARPLGHVARAWRWYKRSPVVALLSLGVVITSVALALALFATMRREAHHRQLAVQAKNVAEAGEKQARWQQYVSDLHAAMAAWENAHLGQVAELLERHFPRPGEEDYRGFEWNYLWHKCEQAKAELNLAHPAGILSIAFSADGKTIGTSAFDGVIRLWDSSSGTLKSTLWGNAERVDAIAFSPDGTILAAAGLDGTIRIWNPETGRELRCLSGHDHAVIKLAFSMDGSEIISSSWDETIRTWDVRTGRHLADLAERADLVSTLDSHQAWLFGREGTDELFRIDMHTGERLQTLHRSEFLLPFRRVAISSERQLGISGSQDGVVRFFRTVDGADIYAEARHKNQIRGPMSRSPDDRFCATSDDNGKVVVWNLESLRVHTEIHGHAGMVRAIAWSPDSRQIATGGGDGWVKVWNRDVKRHAEVLSGHTGFVLAHAFHPLGRWLATAGQSSHEIFVWDVETGEQAFRLNAQHANWIWGLAFSPDGTELASASGDGTLTFWDFEQRELRRQIDVSPGEIYSVAYSRDGTAVVTGDQHGWLYVYERDDDQPQRRIKLGTDEVASIAFSPDGTRLAAAADGKVFHMDFPDCQTIQRCPRINTYVSSIAFSPDGKQIACSGTDEPDVIVYTISGDLPLRLSNPSGVRAVTFSRDGRTIAAACNDFHIRLWDVARHEVRSVLRGHMGWPESVGFSPDGSVLVSASDDRTVRLWRSTPVDVVGQKDREVVSLLRRPPSTSTAGMKIPQRWVPQPGQWEAGLEPLKERLATLPEDLFNLYQLAVLQLHLGNHEDYQQIIGQIVDQIDDKMSSTRLSPMAQRIAIVCSVTHSSENDLQRLHALLQSAVRGDAVQATWPKADRTNMWGRLALAWTELRLGDLPAANTAFAQLRATKAVDRSLKAMILLGVAASSHTKGERDLADQAFLEATELMQEHREWIESQTDGVPYDWQDWLLAKFLEQEVARQLSR